MYNLAVYTCGRRLQLPSNTIDYRFSGYLAKTALQSTYHSWQRTVFRH